MPQGLFLGFCTGVPWLQGFWLACVPETVVSGTPRLLLDECIITVEEDSMSYGV
jgi:hypothetical protein